jgi:tetratricopeptide (TPR) repeat protein
MGVPAPDQRGAAGSAFGGLAALLLSVALAAAAVLYAARSDGPFQWDDYGSIEVNGAIRSPARLLAVRSPADLLGPARPVTELTFALDLSAGGLSPRAFHLTSLALHLLAALALFMLLRALLACGGLARAPLLAALVAGSWVLHPLATEAVAYAAQRSEVLAALLSLLVLLLLRRGARAGAPLPASGWGVGAGGLLLLATGAKVTAVMAPAIFLWSELLLPAAPERLPAVRWRRALLVSAPCWAVALASAARVLWLVRPEDGAGLSAAGAIGPWRYLLTQARVHWLYVRLLAWPAGQSIDHAVAPSPAWPDVATLLALAALVAAALAAGLALRRAPAGAAGGAPRALVFGLGWWILWLVPTSSVIPIDDLAAEHRAYLASAGLLLAGLVALDRGLESVGDRWGGPLLAGGLLLAGWGGLGAALWSRLGTWTSEAALWGDAARTNPASARPANNLGFGLQRLGDLAGADQAYARAQALARTPAELANTLRNRAAVSNLRGRPEEALAHLDLGLAAAPGDFELLAIRADALAALGRYEEAQAEGTRAVTQAPGLAGPRESLGLALLRGGRPAEALAQFEAMSRLDPVHPRARQWQVVALLALRRVVEGCARWAALGAAGRASAEVPEARRAAEWVGCERP